MFQIWFQKSTSVLFQRSFFNNFSFFDWPFRICLFPFVDRFTSLIEMLLIFTKRVFECSEADLHSVSILPDLMLLVVGVRKRAVHKECLILGIKCVVHELDQKKLGIWLWREYKTQYRLLVTLGCLHSRKVWWPKLRYFTDQSGPMVGPHENEF